MKHRRICIYILIILTSCLLPLAFFQIDDMVQNNKQVMWDTTSQAVQEQHPLIQNIYNTYYASLENDTMEVYDIGKTASLTQAQQNTIDAFTTQINTLLDEQILLPAYLNITQTPYEIAYGSLYYKEVDSPLVYRLEQVSSISDTGVSSVEFSMDAQTNKLTYCNMSSNATVSFQDAEKQALLWKYLTYLGLEDIPDWTFVGNAYESYEAKLQVYMDISTMDLQTNVTIGIIPLGQRNSNHFVLS